MNENLATVHKNIEEQRLTIRVHFLLERVCHYLSNDCAFIILGNI